MTSTPPALLTKTVQTAEPAENWLDKTSLRRILFWSVVFLAIIWGMAAWLHRPVIQPIHNEWVLTGQGLASYPMWGYSLLMRLFGSVTAVVTVQTFLGSLATAALMVRLNCLIPRTRKLTTTLFLLSLPWLSYLAFAYQVPMSAAFMLLGLLAVEMGFQTGKTGWGIMAGVMLGLGQNFRSELVLLPGVIFFIVLLLRKLESIRGLPIKPLVACAGAALILQIPWAANCYLNAGRVSFSESNFGHVAFLSLGTLPRNPWDVTSSDAFAQETVTKAGMECSSLSFEGGDFLKEKFITGVRLHPVAYVKSIGVRMGLTVIHPFGFIHLASSPAEEEAARALAGPMGPAMMRKDLPATTALGDPPASRVKVACVLLYSFAQHGLICVVSVLGTIGLALAWGTGPFRLRQPIILCLSIVVLYRCGLNVALGAGGKYMTSVYLCYLPFVINACWQISQLRVWCRPTAPE